MALDPWRIEERMLASSRCTESSMPKPKSDVRHLKPLLTRAQKDMTNNSTGILCYTDLQENDIFSKNNPGLEWSQSGNSPGLINLHHHNEGVSPALNNPIFFLLFSPNSLSIFFFSSSDSPPKTTVIALNVVVYQKKKKKVDQITSVSLLTWNEWVGKFLILHSIL